jgi:hypothetical protein
MESPRIPMSSPGRRRARRTATRAIRLLVLATAATARLAQVASASPSDPVVLHSTYLGAGASDKALAVAADAVGNTYVAGLTQSIDFPLSNAEQPALGGGTDAFVAKIDADGAALIWSTYVGGSGIDAASGIARDAAGNVYIAGYTASADFPTTPNAYQTAFHGGRDAFVVKLDAKGQLVYATYLGGSGIDVADAIAVDGAGHAYVAGYTCSADFPVANAFQSSLHGAPNGCFAAQDAFVARLSADGSKLDYSTYYGGASGADEATGIAVDSTLRAYLTGYTRSLDLPVAGDPLSAYHGGSDAFVATFESDGGLIYATWIGGSADDAGAGIALDAAGAAYVAGSTQSDDFPLVEPLQTQRGGGKDGFVLKLAVSATSQTASLVYSSFLGGTLDDACRGIAVDRDAGAYVTGFTLSPYFPVIFAAQRNFGGAEDAFVTRIDPSGALSWSTFLGGDDIDDGWAIAAGSTLSRGKTIVHVAGWTLSGDLARPGAVQPLPQGSFDGFVARLGERP